MVFNAIHILDTVYFWLLWINPACHSPASMHARWSPFLEQWLTGNIRECQAFSTCPGVITLDKYTS